MVRKRIIRAIILERLKVNSIAKELISSYDESHLFFPDASNLNFAASALASASA